jgi:hypothetical protein
MGRMKLLALASAVFVTGCLSGPQPGDNGRGGEALPTSSTAKKGEMAYHGGPVMHGTFNVYYVWYGNWSSNTAGSILTDLASNIGGSPYYNINSTYSDELGAVSPNVRYAGATRDNYSRGSTLTDDDVFAIVSNAISGNQLPRDRNAMYFVLSSPDVRESSGFCSAYCGWHNHANLGPTDIKYSFVGNPESQCPDLCEPQTDRSPNDNPGADAMAATVARELAATATDYDLNAWFDDKQQENADKCVGIYGDANPTANGSLANVHLGNRDYLLQSIWVNQGAGFCGSHYP